MRIDVSRLFLPLLLILMPVFAPAQWGMPEVVKVTATVEPAEARRGETVKLTVTATVDAEYHLYAMVQPPGTDGPTPTSIDLAEESAAWLTPLGPWKEPKSTIKKDPGFGVDVAYLYGSPLIFERSFTVATDKAPGEHTLSGIFLYQACTETSCLPPLEAEIAVALKVSDAPAVEPAAPAPAPMPAPALLTQVTAAPTSQTEDVVRNTSFPAFIAWAFAFGLLALATPCVFPMIPITITFFTNKASKSTAKSVQYAAIYVLSIILGFTVIGFGFSLVLLALGAGVESSGFANIIAANPWVNLFFAALYIAFALSMFEVFEIGLPPSLSQKLSAVGGRSETLGIAAKAMVFVVISFTCTAPLLGVLIVQAISGEWTRPLFGMMAFATGFALPFFLLALAPQMIGKLPRAGSWLYATKVVMGLVVLAASIKFLSNVDLVLLQERMILSREVILSAWAALSAVAALYLLGIVKLSGDDESVGIGVPRMLLGVLFGFFCIYMTAGASGRNLHTYIEAYMPPNLAQSGMAAAGGGAAENPVEALPWHDNMESALAEARETGRNVFIDFTGYTCTNCRLMEKNMFPRPRVLAGLRDHVLVRLYTDDRKTGKQWQQYQARMFGTVTLPLYAIVTPEEKIIATEAYTTDEDRFVAFLSKGR